MSRYLITGGTGSLGERLVERLLADKTVEEVRVFSRDEYKQSEMARRFGGQDEAESYYLKNKRLTFWLGDIRNLERIKEAALGVDVIIHTAALKRMDTVSRNAAEVADVNITGTRNVMISGRACQRVIFISTDKAYAPSCIYGASKLVAEGIALAEPNSVVWRFGNFIGSRGSVWEIFKEQHASGIPLTITDPQATRFVIGLDEVCDHVLSDVPHGLYYPENLKSMTVLEIAEIVAPGADHRIIGLREGEKMDEAFNDNYTSKKSYEEGKGSYHGHKRLRRLPLGRLLSYVWRRGPWNDS